MLTGLFAEIDAELGKETCNLTARWLRRVVVILLAPHRGRLLIMALFRERGRSVHFLPFTRPLEPNRLPILFNLLTNQTW